MQQITPDLWETAVEQPVPGLTTRAYLLTRKDGNVLFYNTSHSDDIEHMARLGGVAYQFLSHQDELGDSIRVIRERFGAQLGGHVREQAEFARIFLSSGSDGGGGYQAMQPTEWFSHVDHARRKLR